jgi:hypothetical protein
MTNGLEIAEASVVLRRQVDDLRGRDVPPVQMAIALLVLGFRLAIGANHQDALHGCRHLEEFKRAKPGDLQRWILWRFAATERDCFGQVMGVAEAAEKWDQDAGFAAAVRALPDWLEVEAEVMALLSSKPICLCLENPELHDRTLVVPIGGDPAIIAALAQDYENGF